MAKRLTASDRVTKSRQKAADAGRKRLSAMLSADGSALYERLRERYKSEGAMIEAALRSLEETAPTPQRAIQQLRELLDTLEREIER